MSAAVMYAARRHARPRLALLLLTLLLIAASLVHLGLGARWIAPQTVLQALLEYNPRNFDQRIIVDLRLVRLAAALLTGAALGGGIGYYMDVQEAKLRDKMQGTGVSVTRYGYNIVLNMPNNVTFDSNSANLKPAGANTLTGVAMVLKEYEKTAVNVVGYTDSTGSKDLNMRLSQQRADSVASALITQGVAANRIRTTGMGPANPIASNSTAEGKAQNRRVEITLSPLQ